MAIYHFSVKAISRADGRSAVAAAAYRAGELLKDERYEKDQDYTKKTGIEFKHIYAPENTKSDLLDRQKLWNAVEKVENRKDANLAREFEIAFPSEFNAEQRRSMLHELCNDIVKKHGVIVDACIHAPHTKSGSDERNFHAHIMLTSRQIDLETGEFAKKKFRDFSRDNGTKTVQHWREHFATLTNTHLEKNGFNERVDHRSHQARGLDLEPTIHEGPKVTQLRRLGVDTEISLSNDLIKKRNIENRKVLKELDSDIVLSENLIADLKAQKADSEKVERQERIERAQQAEQDEINSKYSEFIDLQDQYIDFAKSCYELKKWNAESIDCIERSYEKSQALYLKKVGDGRVFTHSLQKVFDEENRSRLFKKKIPDYFIDFMQYNAALREQSDNFFQSKNATLEDHRNIPSVIAKLEYVRDFLVEKDIELPVPQQERILGVAVGAVPFSADTIDSDLDTFSDFGSLTYSVDRARSKLKESLKSDAQKAKEHAERMKEKAERDKTQRLYDEQKREQDEIESQIKSIRKSLNLKEIISDDSIKKSFDAFINELCEQKRLRESDSYFLKEYDKSKDLLSDVYTQMQTVSDSNVIRTVASNVTHAIDKCVDDTDKKIFSDSVRKLHKIAENKRELIQEKRQSSKSMEGTRVEKRRSNDSDFEM